MRLRHVLVAGAGLFLPSVLLLTLGCSGGGDGTVDGGNGAGEVVADVHVTVDEVAAAFAADPIAVNGKR